MLSNAICQTLTLKIYVWTHHFKKPSPSALTFYMLYKCLDPFLSVGNGQL